MIRCIKGAAPQAQWSDLLARPVLDRKTPNNDLCTCCDSVDALSTSSSPRPWSPAVHLVGRGLHRAVRSGGDERRGVGELYLRPAPTGGGGGGHRGGRHGAQRFNDVGDCGDRWAGHQHLAGVAGATWAVGSGCSVRATAPWERPRPSSRPGRTLPLGSVSFALQSPRCGPGSLP